MVDGKPAAFSWTNAEWTWFSVVYDGTREPVITADIDLPAQVARMQMH